MAYAEIFDGVIRDELQGGSEFPMELCNIAVGASATIERGTLLCGTSMSGVFEPVAGASDASKILMIAATDFTADSLNSVTTAYSSGVFNREKIKHGGGSSFSLEPFELEMRRQNLHLRTLQEKF